MYHRWAALTLVLALWCLTPKSASGQSVSQPEQQQPRGRKSGSLGQNYPNPFNPETRIPFGIECDGRGGGGPCRIRPHLQRPGAARRRPRSSKGRARSPRICDCPAGTSSRSGTARCRAPAARRPRASTSTSSIVDGERTRQEDDRREVTAREQRSTRSAQANPPGRFSLCHPERAASSRASGAAIRTSHRAPDRQLAALTAPPHRHPRLPARRE